MNRPTIVVAGATGNLGGRIAGDRCSARELVAMVSDVTGKSFRLLRAGGLGALDTLIKVARLVAPGTR